jgi:hypothetical protein
MQLAAYPPLISFDSTIAWSSSFAGVMKLTSVAAVARAAQKQHRDSHPRLASSRAEAPLSRSASGRSSHWDSASGQAPGRSASGQAPLGLVELSDAVRALQLDSQKREEQCDEAKRLSRDAHQRAAELRKRLDGLDLRCDGLEESFKKGVSAQLVKLRDDMSRAQSDLATLHSSMGTVRQAQERGEHVLRQATDDSRALGLAVSELGHVKQSVQLQQVVSAEQGRVLTDARGELGELQQRQAALVNDAAAYKAEAIRKFDALDEYVRHGELRRGVAELQQTSERLKRLARRHEQAR